jgi:hypothetical protein
MKRKKRCPSFFSKFFLLLHKNIHPSLFYLFSRRFDIMGRKKLAGKGGKSRKNTRREEGRSDRDKEELRNHALETCHLPGIPFNHALKPYDINNVSEEDFDMLHTRPGFAHIDRKAMCNLVSIMGPIDAEKFGDFYLARKESLRRVGLSDDAIARIPMLVPLTDQSQINTRTTRYSLEHDAPFISPNIPVINETLHKIYESFIGKTNLIIAMTAILPRPIVLGGLPHLTMQTDLPICMDNVKYTVYLHGMFEMFRNDITLLPDEIRQQVVDKYMQCREAIDAVFFSRSEELKKQFDEAFPGTTPFDAVVPDVFLVALEDLCNQYALRIIQCYEIAICDFLAEKTRPPAPPGVYVSGDGVTTIKIGGAEDNTRPFHSGIPTDFIGPGLWSHDITPRLDQIPVGCEEKMEQDLVSIQKVRREMFGVVDESVRLKYAVSPGETPDSTPLYSSLEALRDHWWFVFNDIPYEQTAHFQQERDKYMAAIAESSVVAAADATAATSATEVGQLVEYVDPVPPLENDTCEGLPDGSLMEE